MVTKFKSCLFSELVTQKDWCERERIKRLPICMTSTNYPCLKKVIYNDRVHKMFNINTQIKIKGSRWT